MLLVRAFEAVLLIEVLGDTHLITGLQGEEGGAWSIVELDVSDNISPLLSVVGDD